MIKKAQRAMQACAAELVQAGTLSHAMDIAAKYIQNTTEASRTACYLLDQDQIFFIPVYSAGYDHPLPPIPIEHLVVAPLLDYRHALDMEHEWLNCNAAFPLTMNQAVHGFWLIGGTNRHTLSQLDEIAKTVSLPLIKARAYESITGHG
jgi:hypothetical protein